jgi:hypothetical protein
MPEVKSGGGTTKYGPGVEVTLTGDEVATAIDAFLVAHDIHVSGPRTITVNGALCVDGSVYVDPSGFVISSGKKYDGRGLAQKQKCHLPQGHRVSENPECKDHW